MTGLYYEGKVLKAFQLSDFDLDIPYFIQDKESLVFICRDKNNTRGRFVIYYYDGLFSIHTGIHERDYTNVTAKYEKILDYIIYVLDYSYFTRNIFEYITSEYRAPEVKEQFKNFIHYIFDVIANSEIFYFTPSTN